VRVDLRAPDDLPADAQLMCWYVAVGDQFAADQTLGEVSTQHYDREIFWERAGVVLELSVAEEHPVRSGQLLARLAPLD